MKKIIKIGLVVLALAIVILYHNVIMVLALKPFAEPCGYGGTSGHSVDCECDGFSFSDMKVGSTVSYCLGECGSCACSEGYPGETSVEVPCEDLSQLDWAFPV